MQGCLLKQSTGLVKRWQERFYVLEPPFLKYYTSGERKVMRGALDTTALLEHKQSIIVDAAGTDGVIIFQP